MNAAPTDWLTAIAILGSGLILGMMFVYFVKRRPAPAAAADDLVLRDREAKRDTLIEELRAPDVTPEERTRLEVETAQVLRQIDDRRKVERRPSSAAGGASGQASVRETAPSQNRGALIGFAWGAGSVLVLVGLGYFVMNQSK